MLGVAPALVWCANSSGDIVDQSLPTTTPALSPGGNTLVAPSGADSPQGARRSDSEDEGAAGAAPHPTSAPSPTLLASADQIVDPSDPTHAAESSALAAAPLVYIGIDDNAFTRYLQGELFEHVLTYLLTYLLTHSFTPSLRGVSEKIDFFGEL